MEPLTLTVVVITANHITIANIVAEAITLIVLVIPASIGVRGFGNADATTAARSVVIIGVIHILIHATTAPSGTEAVTLCRPLCASPVLRWHVKLVVAAGTVIRIITVSMTTFVGP